ncbi:hypothetical protein BD309DRAFT_990469 [Dichomitus squalens]|uniref:Uncharacterized protein n=1 Tax=Dichomitus squalens TaxID=114155 RepID=A0A4Q9NSA0_9APHY|nr:hypothetical protein BD309DRAFT_990469 [Dichomitus squalens]TBU54234.1 hypothetical protein BD310DRAFT_936313 [Dichomitus squalens]
MPAMHSSHSPSAEHLQWESVYDLWRLLRQSTHGRQDSWEEWEAALAASFMLEAPEDQVGPSSDSLVASPISRLPEELFMAIMLQIYDDGSTGPSWYKRFWRSLMLVCKTWRRAIITMPSLWRNVDISHEPRLLVLSVARSRGATLHLTIRSGGTMLVIAPLLSRLRSTIRKLMLHCVRSFDQSQCAFVRQLLSEEGGMPAVEELDLQFILDASESPWEPPKITFAPPIRLDQRLLPRLHTLRLTGVVLNTVTFIGLESMRLRHLDLTWCYADHPDSLLSFLTMLTAFESLETLQINSPVWDEACAPEDVVEERASEDLVLLPCSLRAFTITTDDHRLLLDWILPHVSLSEDVHAKLDAYKTDPEPAGEETPFTFRSMIPASCSLPALRSVQCVRLLVVTPPRWAPTWAGRVASPGLSGGVPPPANFKLLLSFSGRLEYWVQHGRFGLPTLVREVAELFGAAPVHTLELGGDVGSLRTDAWRTVLRAFPRLSSLMLSRWREEALLHWHRVPDDVVHLRLGLVALCEAMATAIGEHVLEEVVLRDKDVVCTLSLKDADGRYCTPTLRGVARNSALLDVTYYGDL